jgi:hypothetical protein
MEGKKTGRKWFGLILGVILMAVFIFVVAPFIEKQVAPFKELSGFIDEHDVNTDAYSYTGSELAAQAVLGARSTVEHPPRGPNR